MIWRVDGLMPRVGCASVRVDSSQNCEPVMCGLRRRGEQPDPIIYAQGWYVNTIGYVPRTMSKVRFWVSVHCWGKEL
jgi:hypothetical protein